MFLQRLRHRRSAIARLKGMVHQGHGLWTVDLVNLLLREDLFGALSHRITFYSARTSADPSYKTTFSGFYDAGGQFDGDEERVNLLYKGLIEKQNELDKWATSSGHRQLFIQRYFPKRYCAAQLFHRKSDLLNNRKFTKQEMQFLLSQPHCLFIVCCNALLLHCERCNPQDKTNESKKRQDFEGHFVVVVYHDSKNEKVYFLDPASECGKDNNDSVILNLLSSD